MFGKCYLASSARNISIFRNSFNYFIIIRFMSPNILIGCFIWFFSFADEQLWTIKLIGSVNFCP